MREGKHISQGENMHMTFLFKDPDENKRHRSRCKYFDKNTKYCSYYMINCKGSNTCEVYEENCLSIKTTNKCEKTPVYNSTKIEDSLDYSKKKFVNKRRLTVEDVRSEIMNFTNKR